MIDTYLPLLGFMILMVGTPGPANLIVMLGGAQVGIKSCMGFIAGLILGKIALNVFIGFGFAIILSGSPMLQQIFNM
jgi:threonine/homoserine/homoserine lactone efflux protein